MMRLLGIIPETLEKELFEKYREVERNFRERRWEPSELNGGKFCEVSFCILRGHIDGAFPLKAHKPTNFLDACQKLEKEPASFGRSVRIQIPRMLVALYEVRNNRNVGHVGGDVNPNMMDAICVLHMCKWVLSELIRVFHEISVDEAARIVESISDRELALVWDTGTRRRVLDNKLSMLEKTLVLLYSYHNLVDEKLLFESVEHYNAAVFRRDILWKAHKQRLIEYNQIGKEVIISPLGAKRVEGEIFPKISI